MRHTLSPVRSLWYSQIDLTGNTGWGLANVLQTCLCLSSSKYVEKTKNMLRLKSTSCLAEVRLFCSGACRVLGLWATSLCLVTELPCLWPLGIFSTVPFTWSLPAMRSCRTPQGSSPSCCDHSMCHGRMPLHSDVLDYSGEISERREKEDRSAVLFHPHDQPERIEWIFLSSGLISDRGRFALAGTPPMHPRVRFVNCLPWLCFQGTRPGHSVITQGKGIFHDDHLSRLTTSGH